MKLFFAFILLVAITCSSIFGLMEHENEKFIQGKWNVSGEVKGENGKVQAWFLEWEFHDGKFTQNGYPPILQEGKYEVLEDFDNNLKLRLFQQKGTFGKEASDLTITIDKEHNRLSIDGKNGFTRAKTKKTS